MAELKARLMAKGVRSPSGCLEFQGARDPKGYGRINVDGHSRLAHRMSWTAEHGPVPDGIAVLHRCDNPPCFDVEHLFLGTLDDNNKDMALKGRAQRTNLSKTHCPQGHAYDEANTYRRKDREARQCRICMREAMRRWKESHRG